MRHEPGDPLPRGPVAHSVNVGPFAWYHRYGNKIGQLKNIYTLHELVDALPVEIVVNPWGHSLQSFVVPPGE